VCVTVSIRKRNVSFARRRRLEDVNCRTSLYWSEIRLGPSWRAYSAPQTRWLVGKGLAAPSPMNPIPAVGPRSPFFPVDPGFVLLKICLVVAVYRDPAAGRRGRSGQGRLCDGVRTRSERWSQRERMHFPRCRLFE